MKGYKYKYRYQEQKRQNELELNWDSFKWRNYDYAIGRFMNVDPLSEKYYHQSHYNFSENKVTSYRELEGLEAVPADNFSKSDQMLVILALGRAKGIYGDAIQGNNTLYQNLPITSQNDDGLAYFLPIISESLGANVITYAGSDSSITASHIAETVLNYKSINPDGKVAMIGHSLGGKDVLDASNIIGENSNNIVNLVIALEAASVINNGSTYSTTVSSNVQNVINVNSNNSSYKNGGGKASSKSQNVATVNLPIGINHTNLDNTFAPFLTPILNKMNNGVNPVKLINTMKFDNVKIINNGDLDNKKQNGSSGSL